MTKMLSYGITDKRQVLAMTKTICDKLGGGENAIKLVVETAQKETKLGAYKDKTPYGAGVGLCQFDLNGFRDTQDRTPESRREAIIKAFNIDILQVSHRELAYSPFLSLLFCRLFYLLRPGAIPSDVLGRAEYWKKWYNSSLGKGTIDQYVEDQKNIEFKY